MPFSLTLLAEYLIPYLKNMIIFNSGGGPKSQYKESMEERRRRISDRID